MTEKIALYYKDINYEALSCLIALEAAGYEVDFVRVDQKSLFGKDLKAMNPASLVPFAHCNNVTYLQAGAILRLAGRKNQDLYGADNITKARVDGWVDMFLNVYSTKVDSVMDSVYDRVSTKVDFRKVDAAIKNLVDHSDYMERTLKDKKNLVGDKLTIADIALVCVFEPFIRFACCPKQRVAMKNTTNLIGSLIDNSLLKKYFRPLSGLKEETFPILKIDVEEQQRIAL